MHIKREKSLDTGWWKKGSWKTKHWSTEYKYLHNGTHLLMWNWETKAKHMLIPRGGPFIENIVLLIKKSNICILCNCLLHFFYASLHFLRLLRPISTSYSFSSEIVFRINSFRHSNNSYKLKQTLLRNQKREGGWKNSQWSVYTLHMQYRARPT